MDVDWGHERKIPEARRSPGVAAGVLGFGAGSIPGGQSPGGRGPFPEPEPGSFDRGDPKSALLSVRSRLGLGSATPGVSGTQQPGSLPGRVQFPGPSCSPPGGFAGPGHLRDHRAAEQPSGAGASLSFGCGCVVALRWPPAGPQHHWQFFKPFPSHPDAGIFYGFDPPAGPGAKDSPGRGCGGWHGSGSRVQPF